MLHYIYFSYVYTCKHTVSVWDGYSQIDIVDKERKKECSYIIDLCFFLTAVIIAEKKMILLTIKYFILQVYLGTNAVNIIEKFTIFL